MNQDEQRGLMNWQEFGLIRWFFYHMTSSLKQQHETLKPLHYCNWCIRRQQRNPYGCYWAQTKTKWKISFNFHFTLETKTTHTLPPATRTICFLIRRDGIMRWWDHLEINKNVWERNEKCWQNNFSIWILSEYISQHALFSAKKASDTTTSNTTTTTICKMAKTFPRWTKIKQKHWSSMSNSLSSLCYTIIYSVFKSSCLKKP